MSFATFYNNVSTLLAGVAPSVRGKDAKVRQQAPPIYLWIWKGIQTAKDARPRNVNTTKILQHDLHQIELHIWGKIEDDVEHMRAALIQALRKDLQGRRYTIGNGQVVDIETTQDGVMLIQEIEVELPTNAVFLPAPVPAQQPGGPDPTVTAPDAVIPSVTITQVDTDTTVTADELSPDELEQGEP